MMGKSVGTVAISPYMKNPRDGHKNLFETRIVCLKREITISQCEGLESAHQHVHLQIWVLFFIKKPVNTPYSMGVSVVSTKKPLISSRSKSLHLISGLIWRNTGDRNTVGYRWILATNFTKRQGLIWFHRCSRPLDSLKINVAMQNCSVVMLAGSCCNYWSCSRYEVLCWPATFEPFECQVTGLMKICLNGSSNKKKGPMSTPSVSIPSVASLPGIDDLRAPSTRKLLALLDIAAAVSANSRVFAWQALPTWLGNLKVGGVELGLFILGPLNEHPYLQKLWVLRWLASQLSLSSIRFWGCQRQGCRPFSCGFREDPSIAERRTTSSRCPWATATWQYPKSLRPNNGREIEKIQSS